ncbi:MAG: ABC1 kinase family protein, partial [Anaerolineae bacterium]
PEYIVEFTRLLDSAPPAPTSEIIGTIERELNRPLTALFASFEEEPIGSASIGQVHRATLLDGTPVAVKVQRPGVDSVVEADLALLLTQTRFLQAHSDFLARYHIHALAEEFAQALRDELDYSLEGHNADQLRTGNSDESVMFPQVYWQLTTRRVITLSEIQGTKLSEIMQLRTEGYDLTSIADAVTAIYLKQIFQQGVFHADPHPANILVQGQKIGLVDFGAVGYLSPKLRADLANLLFALVNQRVETMVDIIVDMGITDASTDKSQLEADIQRLVRHYYGVNLEGFPITEFLNDIMGISFKHHVRLPSDLILLVRALLVLEGVVLYLDPAFNLAKHIEPFGRKLVKERLSIPSQIGDAIINLQELQRLLSHVPQRADIISSQLERGELTVGIELRRLSQTMRKLDTIANRLSFSIIVAALIVGSALAGIGGGLTLTIPFTKIAIPIAQFGFISASILGALLLISIIRSRGL